MNVNAIFRSKHAIQVYINFMIESESGRAGLDSTFNILQIVYSIHILSWKWSMINLVEFMKMSRRNIYFS